MTMLTGMENELPCGQEAGIRVPGSEARESSTATPAVDAGHENPRGTPDKDGEEDDDSDPASPDSPEAALSAQRERAFQDLCPMDRPLMEAFFTHDHGRPASLLASILNGRRTELSTVRTDHLVPSACTGFMQTEVVAKLGIYGKEVRDGALCSLLSVEFGHDALSASALEARNMESAAALAIEAMNAEEDLPSYPTLTVVSVVERDSHETGQMVRFTDVRAGLERPEGVPPLRFVTYDLTVRDEERRPADVTLAAEAEDLLQVAQGHEQDPDESPASWLAHDLLCTRSGDMHFETNRAAMQAAKETMKGARELRDQLREHGRIAKEAEHLEGREEERVDALRRLTRDGMELAEALERLGYRASDEERYRELLQIR